MSNSWDEMRRGKEAGFFDKENEEALKRLGDRNGPRKSPVTGETMNELNLMGMTVDQCSTSGGVWLDAEELQEIQRLLQSKEPSSVNLVKEFFDQLLGKS